jgi:MFS transporter, YNFM family, putative membrane transport protein
MDMASGSQPASRPSFDLQIFAVMLAGACTFLNVYCTQPLLPYLRQIFHASELEVSLTVSATTFAVAITAPFIGVFAERHGRKKVIVPSLFGVTIPTLLAATSPGLHSLIFWRFAQGLFVPGIIAVMIAYINEEWAGRGVGRVMAAYVTGTVIGGFLGRFLSGVVATHINWRAAFIVIGILNLLGSFAVRAWLPKAQNFKAAEHFSHVIADARDHLRNPRLLAVFVLGFMVLFSIVGCFTYTNFYLAAPPFNLNTSQLGGIFFVYLLGVIFTPMSGKFLDHYGFRRTAVLFCTMCIIGLLLTLVRSLPVIIIGLAIFCGGIFIAQSSATVQTGALARRARSSAAGLYVTLYYLGGSAGAVVTGWFWVWRGWPASIALLVVVSVLTLWLAFLASHEPVAVHAEDAIVAPGD